MARFGKDPSAVIGSADPSGLVQVIPRDWRGGAHAFKCGHFLGAGETGNPLFWYDHADYFDGPVPVTKPLTPTEIRKDYELNTGIAIVRRLGKVDPMHTPGILVAGHATLPASSRAGVSAQSDSSPL